MRRHLLIAASLLAFLSPAKAADSTVTALTAASALGGTELLYCVQSAADRKCTPLQFATYVFGLASGDITFNGTGTGTLKNTGPGATGPLGSATVAPIITIDAQGRVTALTSATITPAIGSVTGLGTGCATFLATPSSANLAACITDETGSGANVFGTAPTISSPTINTTATLGFVTGGGTQCLQASNTGVVTGTGSACGGSGSTGANPTATAGPTAVNGVATTFMRSDGAPAVQQGSNSQKGIVQVDGTTIVAASGVISAGGVAASSQTGTNYPIVAGDFGKLILLSNASPQAPTLPIASTTGANWVTNVCNVGAGAQTITPTTSTIGGASTYVLRAGSAAAPTCITIQSDGTTYNVIPDSPALGSGVAAQLANAVSTAGGSTQTIAAGTATLGTSAITSGSCATVVTVTATNTATTDTISFTPNADITAVTGYAPVTTGGLAIYPYPTSGNVNFKICNPTSSSITPGAVALNWRVTR